MQKNAIGIQNDPAEMTRRNFLYLTGASAVGLLAGCAANPVTGKSQLMLMSESDEIQVDRQQSPFQFSSDYGVTQDKALENYVNRTGRNLAAHTHRLQMPYSFSVVNATYVNAYAFPGGTIAATRGILLSLENEAELAALLGHELGHVNARHTAQQMSKGMLTQSLVGGVSAVAGAYGSGYGQLVSQMGMVGAGALLASYSRDNEREADDLGMAYMVGAGYNSEGMVGLLEMLQSLSRQKPNAIELMFATHPMSQERYRTAVAASRDKYPTPGNAPLYRDRYMHHTARLRAMKGAIEAMQNGEKEMARKNYQGAESLFKKAIVKSPRDYTLLVMMAKCQLVQHKDNKAMQYAEIAKKVYPQEAQAYHVSGFSKIRTKRFASALQDFEAYDRRLPGNPSMVFFKGLALEGMNRKKDAADHFYRYLQNVREGEQAKYAYNRLVDWGYIK